MIDLLWFLGFLAGWLMRPATEVIFKIALKIFINALKESRK